MTATLPPQAPPAASGRDGAGQPLQQRSRPERPLHAVDALVAALALAVGTSALAGTMIGLGWLGPSLEIIAVVYLVGLGGRLIRLPALAGVALQVVAVILTLTSAFAVGGIGGVIPTPDVARQAGQLLSGAWHQIVVTAAPAPVTPELSFLVAMAVGVAAVIVDVLVAHAKAPALVALPLLCLYSVPASILDHLLPWYTFAAPAVLYGVLLAVALHGRDRVGRRAGFDLARSGTVVLVAAIAVSILVGDAITAVGTTGRIPKTGVGPGSQLGLSPFTTLHGDLQQSTPVDLLTVSGLDKPDYLRTVALNKWTPGQGWSLGALTSNGAVRPAAGLPGIAPAVAGAGTEQVTVNSLAFRDRFLPILKGTTSVSGIGGGWSFDTALVSIFRATPEDPGAYKLTVSTAEPTAAQLEAATVLRGGELTEAGDTPAMVGELARQVTRSAPTAFDKARALVDFFTDPGNGFVYSLSVPTGNSGDALVDFLNNRQGYCEQYASAMAVMLRTLGIPARVAIGFTQGEQQPDGSYLISSHDAHAWVEVPFNGYGWVRFDPTPLADGLGGQQGWADNSPTATPTPTTAPAETQTAGPAPTGHLGEQRLRPDDTDAAQAAASALTGRPAGLPAAIWWLIGVILVLGSMLSAPSALRRIRRRRRFAAVRAGSADAAWREIEDLAIDHGITLRASETARTTANRLARTAHLSDRARDSLRDLVIEAERQWYSAPAELVGVGSGAAGSETGSSGAGLANGPLATTTEPRAEAEEMIAAVRALDAGLSGSAPLTVGDRLLPRSVRPGTRR